MVIAFIFQHGQTTSINYVIEPHAQGRLFRFQKFNGLLVLRYTRFQITFSLSNINVIATCQGNFINQKRFFVIFNWVFERWQKLPIVLTGLVATFVTFLSFEVLVRLQLNLQSDKIEISRVLF